MTPDWIFQLIWYFAGIGGTGALWYFLSQRCYHAALWTGFITGVLVLLAVTLYIRNNLLRKEQRIATANPVPVQPTSTNLSEETNTSVNPRPEAPKVYIQIKSLDEIFSRIKSLNPLERDLVVNQTYIGRWVRSNGAIRSISRYTHIINKGYTVTVDGGSSAIAQLEFLSTERHLIEPLEEGDLISYEAKIAAVYSPDRIYLTDVILTKPEERTFVNNQPEELTRVFKERTEIQARTMTAGAIGKWMKVSGPLGNIGEFTSFAQVTFAFRTNDYPTIYMYIRKKKWFDRVSVLNRGDSITVVGRIREIRYGELHLDNCELIDS